MKRHTQPRRVWRIFAVVAVLAAIVFGYLNANPIHLSSDDLEQPGTRQEHAEQADVVVLVWEDAIRHSTEDGAFAQTDWSWTWVDSLESLFGPVRIAEVDALEGNTLAGSRYAVVTHSAAIHPQIDRSVHIFEQFVARGGVLVLERPEGAMRAAFSADGRAGTRTPTAVSHVGGVSQDVATALREMPLFTRFVGSTGPLAGSETLLSMDGAPVVYRLSRAGGSVVTVDFDFGLAIVSLQQGRPQADSFLVAGDGPHTTLDLVAAPFMLDAEVPYADLLEHFVAVEAMGSDNPWVAWWPYPGGADGALVMTHDVEQSAHAALWLADYELTHQATSSFFLGYGALPDEETAMPYVSEGIGLSALWERGSENRTGSRRLVGFAGVTPFFREARLAELDAALDRFDSPLPRGARTLDGLWAEEFTQPFNVMAAAGIAFDSSYGTAPWGSELLAAYRFGTGRPFLALDRNGLPSGPYELPVVAPEVQLETQVEALHRFLRRSKRAHHQTITVRTPGELFIREQSLALYDAWQGLLTAARHENHWVTGAERLIAFERVRRQRGLTSEPTLSDDSTLTVRVSFAEGPDNMWVMLPVGAGGRELRSLRRANGDAIEFESRRVFGSELAIAPAPSGPGVIEARYR